MDWGQERRRFGCGGADTELPRHPETPRIVSLVETLTPREMCPVQGLMPP